MSIIIKTISKNTCIAKIEIILSRSTGIKIYSDES